MRKLLRYLIRYLTARNLRDSFGALLDYHEQRLVRELNQIRRDFHSAVAENEVRSRDAIARFAALAGQAEQLLKAAGIAPSPAPVTVFTAVEAARLRGLLLSLDTKRDERHKMFATLLVHRRRVLDLDASDGRLLQLLASLGIEGAGVTDAPELAVEARSQGMDLRVQTLDEITRSLRPDAFDAVVADRLADRLPDAELRAVIDAIHAGLPDNGVALFTIRNPAIITGMPVSAGEFSRRPEVLAFFLGLRFGKVETIEGPRDRPYFVEGTPVSDTAPSVQDLSTVVAHNAKGLNELAGGPGDLLLCATKVVPCVQP